MIPRADCIVLLMPIDNEARAIVIETREILDHWISHYACDIDLQSRRVDLPKYKTSVGIKHFELETYGFIFNVNNM